MWRSVRDPSTVDTFLRENRGAGASERLAELLRWLRSNATQRELYVVTSLGKLNFTTSSNYMEGNDHPHVTIVRDGRTYSVSYFAAGETEPTSSTSGVHEAELVETVQHFLLRLLQETE